jgi:SAM-dependent methyltransferase
VRTEPTRQPYDAIYDEFDAQLMRRFRSEAYGEDIGQHSWVSAAEIRADICRLGLTSSQRFLDLGCGPCGPLTFILRVIGCRATGLDISAAAVRAGHRRAAALGVDHLATIEQADLNAALPQEGRSFDAVMSLDVVVHVLDRTALFREVARVLIPGGKFLFTDAAVVRGAISNEEVASRSMYGYMQFVAPGVNERALEKAGLQLIEMEDRTKSVLASASGRLAARRAHREELEAVEGASGFEREVQYLETVIALARRGALSRLMYLARCNATA